MKGRGLRYDRPKDTTKHLIRSEKIKGRLIHTLSAKTKKSPKSSSIAHCVTCLRYNTRRIAETN